MIKINGKSVTKGIAIGKLAFISAQKSEISRQTISDKHSEIFRYQEAKARLTDELHRLFEKAKFEAGEKSAQIFEIHSMMLDDKDFNDLIENKIKDESINAEYAVKIAEDEFSDFLLSTNDEYMKARCADIHDISRRLIEILTKKESSRLSLSENSIICADELAPSETVKLDKSKVIAFATRFGSAQSHTAILAGSMNIPALIGLGSSLSTEYNGMLAVIDGYDGCLYIEPTPEILEKARHRLILDTEHKERLKKLKGLDNISEDGKRIMLYANIGTPNDVAEALENDAGGIGLFRSEFLYLKSDSLPTEEEQFIAYKSVLERMGNKKVIIRTLDIGADKNVEYLNLDKEENPAMGFRAIRLCLNNRDIFRTQLRALLRASAYGKLSIMIPMIISVDEVRQVRSILEEIKSELRGLDIPFDSAVEFGIMIETPAAVMISDLLAREVDFFSIGTNDLTQYSLAIDRQNRSLDPFFNPYHLSVKRMIKQTVENAHKARIWCGICGELASDLSMTETLLSLGVDELSVSAPAILPLREKIRSVNISGAKNEILINI